MMIHVYPSFSLLRPAWHTALVCFFLSIATAFAQSPQTLTVPDATGGSPVALWENRAIVGIQGGACIFEQDSTGWVKVATLQPTGVGNVYGLSVDIQRDRAIIGDMSSRRAFIFRYLPKRNAWVQEAELVSPNTDTDGGFGISVSIQGGRAMVGDHWDNDLGTSSGAVYVYQRSFGKWKFDQKLVPSVPTYYTDSDGTTSISFDYYLYGWSTSIDLGRAVVASYWQSAAYVYNRSFGSWREQQVLEQLYPLLPSVDITGKYIAANTSENVFVFNLRQGNWQGTRINQPSGDAYGDNPVAITPTKLAFQREFDDFSGPEARREVFLYERQGATWQLRQTLEEAETPAFGKSLDLYGDKLIVGTEGGFAGVYPTETAPAARTITSQDSTTQAPEGIIASLTTEQSVSVYPVPLGNQLHVDLGTPSAQPVSVVLYDMFGRQLAMATQTVSTGPTLTLDLTTASIPSGVVFLEVNSVETGRQIMKLIK